MGKVKGSGGGDILSLDKSKQKEVAKQTIELKKKIKDGTITVKDGRKTLKTNAEQHRGLIFISHLPHGFYEEQLKGYFVQFGKVTNVKVCRSNKTGRSKGYGYVEFSHPEVAKIAAETMNNYLMFKKRLTAEYIPYEKRPKSLFHGKSSNAVTYSAKVRREKQYQVNLKVSEKTQQMRTRRRLTRVNKKLQRLQQFGINTTFLPVAVENIKKEKLTDVQKISQDDSTISLKKTKKFVNSGSSRTSAKKKLNSVEMGSPGKMLLSKSLDSVQAIISPDTKKERSKTPTARVHKSTLTEVKKKKKKPSKGVSKRTNKLAPLNADTVRKIARELIRKKGNSLLNSKINYTKPTNKKSPKSKKSSKK